MTLHLNRLLNLMHLNAKSIPMLVLVLFPIIFIAIIIFPIISEAMVYNPHGYPYAFDKDALNYVLSVPPYLTIRPLIDTLTSEYRIPITNTTLYNVTADTSVIQSYVISPIPISSYIHREVDEESALLYSKYGIFPKATIITGYSISAEILFSGKYYCYGRATR